MLTSQGADNAGRGTMERRAADVANTAAILVLNKPESNPGIAIGSTVQQVSLGNTTAYTINGQYYSKTATANLWTLSGVTVPVSSFQKYALLLDSAGTATVQEATIYTGTDGTMLRWSNVSGRNRYSALNFFNAAGKTVIGSVTVQTNASTTFVPGTTALNAAGVTVTFTSGIDQSLIPLIGDLSGRAFGGLI